MIIIDGLPFLINIIRNTSTLCYQLFRGYSQQHSCLSLFSAYLTLHRPQPLSPTSYSFFKNWSLIIKIGSCAIASSHYRPSNQPIRREQSRATAKNTISQSYTLATVTANILIFWRKRLGPTGPTAEATIIDGAARVEGTKIAPPAFAENTMAHCVEVKY